MSKLGKVVVLAVLALWGLATMHCKLEALPGLDFLKCCCPGEPPPSGHTDCESDGCGAVEEGGYRAEEQTASAPLPPLLLADRSAVMAALLAELRNPDPVPSPPPEIPRAWQFALRAARSPRAPSPLA